MAAVGHTTTSRLQELRMLLLDEERSSQKELREALDALEKKMLDPRVQKEQLQPHFDEHIAYLQEKFPELFSDSLNKALAKQIRDSRDSMIEAL
jgi:ribosomal protein L16 Arg81 hydroxylase